MRRACVTGLLAHTSGEQRRDACAEAVQQPLAHAAHVVVRPRSRPSSVQHLCLRARRGDDLELVVVWFRAPLGLPQLRSPPEVPHQALRQDARILRPARPRRRRGAVRNNAVPGVRQDTRDVLYGLCAGTLCTVVPLASTLRMVWWCVADIHGVRWGPVLFCVWRGRAAPVELFDSPLLRGLQWTLGSSSQRVQHAHNVHTVERAHDTQLF